MQLHDASRHGSARARQAPVAIEALKMPEASKG